MPDGTTTTTFEGEFSTSEVKIEINTTPASSTATYAEIADMENAKISIEGNTEEWYSIKDGGWGNALVTAKKFKISLSGKRCVGDTGNDYIASLLTKIGRDCNTDIKITFPNDDTFTGKVAALVTDFGTDNAESVAPLVAELTGRGAPTYTPAT